MKFDPFTVNVNAAPPAVTEDGEMELIDGTGLGGGELLPPPPPPHAASSSVTRTAGNDRIALKYRITPP
jgi:hypothetical protein